MSLRPAASRFVDASSPARLAYARERRPSALSVIRPVRFSFESYRLAMRCQMGGERAVCDAPSVFSCALAQLNCDRQLA
jgi:hypothetical protein